jgi:hypothetical protein
VVPFVRVGGQWSIGCNFPTSNMGGCKFATSNMGGWMVPLACAGGCERTYYVHSCIQCYHDQSKLHMHSCIFNVIIIRSNFSVS